MQGDAGNDTAEANGSDTAGDDFTIAAERRRASTSTGSTSCPFSLDIGTTETLVVNGLGGNDTITGAAGLDGLIELQLSAAATATTRSSAATATTC